MLPSKCLRGPPRTRATELHGSPARRQSDRLAIRRCEQLFAGRLRRVARTTVSAVTHARSLAAPPRDGQNHGHGQSRPPDRARRDVPAPGATPTAHMHVASVMVFEGKAPAYDELVEHDREPPAPRPALPPAPGLRAARPGPAGVGRRPALQPALPRPPHGAAAPGLRASSSSTSPGACSRSGSTAPSRCGRSGSWTSSRATASRCSPRPTTRSSTASRASTSRPCCSTRRPTRRRPRRPSAPWVARPLPERRPAAGRGAARARHRCRPRSCAARVRCCAGRAGSLRSVVDDAAAVGALACGGINPRRRDPVQRVDLGPHRRFDWVEADLERLQGDQELARRHAQRRRARVVSLRARPLPAPTAAIPTDGLELKAMVPVSVRADSERGALGNQVAAMWAPLPVWSEDPVERLRARARRDGASSRSPARPSARRCSPTSPDFAPPTIMAQAARLQARQRFFNLVVTNVPGPQFPLYLLGRAHAWRSTRWSRWPRTWRWASRS